MSEGGKERCENCRHWLTPQGVVERHYAAAKQHMEAANKFGQCRRHPPGHECEESYDYPYSLPTHWCDGWKPK
ncbi:MAG: hypothetical protein OEO83_05420 [Alphaproteobacteria bacterium]|nr:hypothetical protein [Alphaproteobacteria bacterium]